MFEPTLSIIAPVYNEEDGIDEFHRRVDAMLSASKLDAEILLVNDGSTDGSSSALNALRAKDKRVRVLEFSRNFGHQAAIKAGIDHARGKALVIIDSDLQDPPEAIPEMIAKWKEGFDVVYAVRASRAGESPFKKLTAALYYRLLNRAAGVRIPVDTGDFRLISRRVADAVKTVRERNLYLRGLIAWLGFKQVGLPIQRAPRFAGSTHYDLARMFGLAWNGLVQFSTFPLDAAGWAGAFLLAFSVYAYLTGAGALIVAVFGVGGVQLIFLAVLGAYLSRALDETRSRPLYVLKDEHSGS